MGSSDLDRPRQASTGLRNVAYVTNAHANLSFHSSSSILCQWGNVSEADITGRLARRSSEQRHKADHYFILSPISLLISQATTVAIAKETPDVRVGS